MRRFLMICVLLSTCYAFGLSTEGVWSGSFSVGSWQGGLQLKLHPSRRGWAAAAAVQPLGRLATPNVEKFNFTTANISFELVVEKERLRFLGQRTTRGFEGTVRMGRAVGHWSAIKLTTNLAPAELPPPTGPFPVGRTSFVWTDPHREEAAAPGMNERRRLVVYLWYPAAHPEKCDPAPYLPDLEAMKPYLPKEVAQAVPKLRIPACSDVPLSDANARYPVLIFAGGDEFKTLGYSALQMDLASHGYIVAAIDFPYNAPVIAFPDGSKVMHVQDGVPLPPRPPNSSEDSRQRLFDQTLAELDYWAHDIAFVQRQISSLDGNSGSLFFHRIDTSRVGAFGHSRGGLAAFRACQLDASIHACANLDGRYRERPYPLSSPADAPHQPFLWIRGPVYVFTDDDLAKMGVTRKQFQDEVDLRNSIMRAINAGSDSVYIDEIGFDHLDFADFRALEAGISMEERAAREHVLAITRGYLLEFFSSSLNNGKPEFRVHQDRHRFPDTTLIQYSPQTGH